MYRHEKTFLWDFILLGCNVLLILFNIMPQINLFWLITWSIIGGIRLVVLVLHQIKWRQIYKLEYEEMKNNNKKDLQ